MAEPPPEDRDRRTDEDLFEDLDQFFAPLEDDWPEGDQPDQPPGRDVTPAPTEAGARPEDAPSEAEAEEAAAPAERGEAAASAEEALADLDELAREEDWIAEATAEMRPESWDLGEGAEPAEPAADVPAAGEEPPAAVPPVPGGSLTPDDLRTPPPAYADLPGPREEEAAERTPAPERDDILADEPTMDDLEMPLAFDDELLEEEPPAREPDADVVQVTSEIPTGDLPPPEPPPDVEPEAEDVEAAAEHFAEGLRADDVERDLLSDLEGPTTTTAPIDRGAVLEQAGLPGEPEEPEEPGEPAEEGAERETAAVAAAEAGMGEGEAPPSWEDGAAEAATTTGRPEEGAPGPRVERNLVAAFVSGILLLAVAIALLAISTGAFAFLAGAVILLAQGELYAVMRKGGYEPATLFGLAMGLLIVVAAFLKGPLAMVFGLSLSMLLVVPWYMAAPPAARKGTLRDAGVTLLGIVYVPFLAGFALLLLRASSAAAPDIGRDIFLVVIGMTVLYDISAYAIGSLWGSRPLAATISPRKSWEGAIGATFVLLLAALAIVPQIDPFEPGNAVGLALVIALAAPLGDLVESALKRDLGVKDMSSLLPGHGGMLDRIDAILFAAPAAFWFLFIALPA